MARTVKVIAAGLCSALFLSVPTFAITNTSLVTIGVPDAVLHASGQASPNALVSIRENGSTIGTTTADASGNFSLSLGGQATGIRTFQISYTDGALHTSAIYTKQLAVQPQQTTNLSAFLSPTIARPGPSALQAGSVAQINGYTVPFANIKLFLGTSGAPKSTLANATGFYEFLVPTSGLQSGTYTAYTIASTNSAGQSQSSPNVSFVVSAQGTPAAPDLVTQPNALSPPVSVRPDDGATISGNTVTITGESTPFAQINVYQDGKIIGSVFANVLGKWTFKYVATTSPVTLTFQSCLNDVCSIQTKTYTYFFTDIGSVCKPDFALAEYRFWGVRAGETIRLQLKGADGFRGTLAIDWGDGVQEKFSVDSSERRSFEKQYKTTGQYNGHVRLTATDGASACSVSRYFSVGVTDRSAIPWWLWVVFAASILFAAWFVYQRYYRKQRS